MDNGNRRIVQHTRQGEIGVDEQHLIVTPTTFLRPDENVSVAAADVLRRFLRVGRTAADS